MPLLPLSFSLQLSTTHPSQATFLSYSGRLGDDSCRFDVSPIDDLGLGLASIPMLTFGLLVSIPLLLEHMLLCRVSMISLAESLTLVVLALVLLVPTANSIVATTSGLFGILTLLFSLWLDSHRSFSCEA